MSIVIKNRTIGEGRPLICGPIVAKSIEGLRRECNCIVGKPIDMVEWRIDHYLKNNNRDALAKAYEEINKFISNLPLLITYRTVNEGGEEGYPIEKTISEADYIELIKYIVDNSIGDIVDIEVSVSSEQNVSELIEYVHGKGVKVIASKHDFVKTPDKAEMSETFEKMKRTGADIFKIAVMPNAPEDVIRLMEFSRESKNTYDNPIITISMGKLGVISRIAGELDGSAVTFASVTKESAPGQLPCVRLIRMLRNVSVMNGNVYLAGFMGCGKSTVARELERRTGMPTVDIDAAIVEREGVSIPEIFADKGEEEFRNIETEVLREESEKGGRIIACGGGVVLRDENITIMKRYGTVILLTARPETIYSRVCSDTNRPLLNNNMSVEHISNMLEARRAAYEKSADIVIETDNIDVSDIAYTIKKIL